MAIHSTKQWQTIGRLATAFSGRRMTEQETGESGAMLLTFTETDGNPRQAQIRIGAAGTAEGIWANEHDTTCPVWRHRIELVVELGCTGAPELAGAFYEYDHYGDQEVELCECGAMDGMREDQAHDVSRGMGNEIEYFGEAFATVGGVAVDPDDESWRDEPAEELQASLPEPDSHAKGFAAGYAAATHDMLQQGSTANARLVELWRELGAAKDGDDRAWAFVTALTTEEER